MHQYEEEKQYAQFYKNETEISTVRGIRERLIGYMFHFLLIIFKINLIPRRISIYICTKTKMRKRERCELMRRVCEIWFFEYQKKVVVGD